MTVKGGGWETTEGEATLLTKRAREHMSSVITEISNRNLSFKTNFILFEDLIQCIKAT